MILPLNIEDRLLPENRHMQKNYSFFHRFFDISLTIVPLKRIDDEVGWRTML